MKVFLALTLCLFVTACSESPAPHQSITHPHKEISLQEKQSFTPQDKISVSAVGDMLIHDRVYNDAKSSDSFNFMPMLEKVKPYLEDTTITMANQETMIGGESIGLSSYPSFNTPQEFGDALKELGVDVVTLANNHTLDRGEKSVLKAIEHWESLEMMYTGAFKNKEDQNKIRVYETKEGIDVSFLSYTYGTNGIPVPKGKSHLVNLIDKKQIKSEVEMANRKSDAIILNMHFGDEYEPLPNKEQKDLAQFAADLGVDVLIGHHPHVLQPIEWVEGKNEHKMLTVYSLGNFFSGQNALEKRIGGVFKFDLIRKEEKIAVEKPRFLLTYVTSEGSHAYEVLPMHELDNNLLPDYKRIMKEEKVHLKQWMPELEFVK
ncbi:CapA family protein [Halobacillus sp. B23F22_1]|uniref:CapA family protein n=1 Tax=Halobacillus sp. B23F22_1 TaxID=3459514 RepID=UPI00373F462B